MAEVCGVDEAAVRALLFDRGLQADYELGKWNSSEFAERVRCELQVKVSDEALLAASNDIFQVNQSVMPYVNWLEKMPLRLGILSNTCQGHWEHCCRRFPFLRSSFQYSVLSFEVGCAKPEPAIYGRAIESAGVSAEQILYLDDRTENVVGAREMGMQAVEFHDVEDLRHALNQFGIIVSP